MMRKKSIVKALQGYRRSASGNTYVEFALVLPILILLCFPVIDFGVVIFSKINLRTAVTAGVDSGMEVTSLASNVKTSIENAMPISNMTLNVSKYCQCADNTVTTCSNRCSDGNYPDHYYEIDADATVDLYLNYLLLPNPFPISEKAILMVP